MSLYDLLKNILFDISKHYGGRKLISYNKLDLWQIQVTSQMSCSASCMSMFIITLSRVQFKNFNLHLYFVFAVTTVKGSVDHSSQM